MHPLAGQGINTGFRDARELSTLLKDRGGQNDVGDASRCAATTASAARRTHQQFTTYGLKQLFNNENPLLRSLRNSGLNLRKPVTPLKKQLMRHALN